MPESEFPQKVLTPTELLNIKASILDRALVRGNELTKFLHEPPYGSLKINDADSDGLIDLGVDVTRVLVGIRRIIDSAYQDLTSDDRNRNSHEGKIIADQILQAHQQPKTHY